MRPALMPLILALGPGLGFGLGVSLACGPAMARVPVVVTDTAPVQSLTALVMGDLGSPGRLIAPGTSPHDGAFRPSDAATLAQADVVIWTGAGLVPYLADPIATLAPDARVLALLDAPGWAALPLRHDADFGSDGDHGDDHGAIDPHAWLDPAVAAAWLDSIAGALAAADPDNAATYRANAAGSAADLADLGARLTAELAPLAGRAYLVPHDAFQYFETAFGLPASGAISLSDATLPGPAHVADLRARLAEGHITCILTDPETSPDLVALLIRDSAVRTALADPDGITLEPGPGLYAALIEGVARALTDCLR